MAAFASTAAVVVAGPVVLPCRKGARRCVAARAIAAAVAAPAVAGRTHYEVLGVGAGASRGEIKAAYRRLAREVHPDAGSGDGEGFIRLHAAYATLSDTDQRARYDREVAALFRRAAAPASFRRRTWETDQCW
ncbi:hypothetical protein BRADI_1g30113v3 [Brachypodium distachyon]|uniref:J domain-containing protein n=2 Tax=Brachypodium distachyon TaxID=15368 RepID=A0A2K2DM17_BRADI|nr:hypothetical protein BRADI_1g30113v3 [Brachypodium distachyon]